MQKLQLEVGRQAWSGQPTSHVDPGISDVTVITAGCTEKLSLPRLCTRRVHAVNSCVYTLQSTPTCLSAAPQASTYQPASLQAC